jgi:hypothetical protein
MAATKLWEVYDIETPFEKAAVAYMTTIFSDDLGQYSIVRTINDDTLLTPRIEVRFELGDAMEPIPQRGGGASPSTLDYRNFNAQFFARVVTDNAQDQEDDHHKARGTVRQCLAVSSDIFSTTGSGGAPQLTGTVTAATSSPTNNCIASGAEFSDEIAVGDTIKFVSSEGTETNTVKTVTSNTQLLLKNNFEFNQLGANIFRVQSFTYGPALELFTVNYIKPESTVYETDGTFNVSELSYNMVIGIRSDAWPAS